MTRLCGQVWLAVGVLLWVAVVRPAHADEPPLLTPAQAQERIAALFSVPPAQVSDVHLESSLQHGPGDYEASLPDLVEVRVDAVSGQLTFYSNGASDDGETSWTLTAQEAADAARAFCAAKEIPVPAGWVQSVTTEPGPDYGDGGKKYRVDFVEKQGEVELLSFTGAVIGATTGTVYALGNYRDGVTVSVDPPYLSLEQAGAAAATVVQQEYPTATNITTLPGSVLLVGWHPWVPNLQYLHWSLMLGFDFQPEGLTELVHARMVFDVDARSAEVTMHYGPASMMPSPKSPTAKAASPVGRAAPPSGVQPTAPPSAARPSLKTPDGSRPQPDSRRLTEQVTRAAQARRLLRDHRQATVSMSWSARRGCELE